MAPALPALPTADICEQATVRLVPSAYFKPPVLAPLADNAADLTILALIEGMTSGRLQAEAQGLAALSARELAYGVWGETYINAAFTYTRAEGNRFNDASRGAWYAAFEDLTAITEVAFHRTRELTRIGVFEDEAIYHGLLASFIGRFHDARGEARGEGVLGDDPATAYPLGQALARDLRKGGSIGLIYPSVRHPAGTCLAAFHPHTVQNVRLGARWKLSWTGSPHYTVSGA
ncbi:RES family NAD+ phosphorylase [Hyphomonas sp.]|uniref:RES family NAD+ phosphorylase n=1 Tax=Hyphomonas sp. TaxID=87 RepID=UPI00391B7F9D